MAQINRRERRVRREIYKNLCVFGVLCGEILNLSVNQQVTIFAIAGLSLIPPLLYRDLIDQAIPNRDVARLNWLALGMIGIPLVNALISLGQRYLSATIGESLIADLRNALFNHMQRMSLRFFTQIKSIVTYSYGVRVRL